MTCNAPTLLPVGGPTWEGIGMFTSARLLGIGIVGLGLVLVAAAQLPAPAQDVGSGVAAILELADNLDGKDASRKAKKIVEDHEETCGISVAFSLRTNGGVGIGSAARAGHKDSIEHLVRDWSGDRPPTQEE